MVKASPVKDNMKFTSTERYSGQNLNLCQQNNNCVTKAVCPTQARRLKERQELRTLYKKLREVIPSCKSKPVSSLDIVLQAVDYINELHGMLEEEQPNAPKPFPKVANQPIIDAQMLQMAANNARNMSFRDVTNVTMTTTSQPTTRIRD